MEYGLAVFRARNETITFANLLRSYGVRVMVVSTPRKINVSCGISVKFSVANLEDARRLLGRRKFDSFGGLFHVYQTGANARYVPV